MGRLAADVKPDTIINMGDWADMASLCSYDKGTGAHEGRRYVEDIAAANEALQLFDEGLYHRTRANKKKNPRIRKVALEGNHEQRIDRATSASPELAGAISTDDIKFKRYGWEYHRYEGSTPAIVMLDGIAYAHFHTSGVMGRAISGEHPCYSMLAKKHISCVVGHLHLFDYAERNRADGQRIQALLAGCAMDTKQFEEYAGNSNRMWWKGAVVLRNVRNGEFDFERISMDVIEKEYS